MKIRITVNKINKNLVKDNDRRMVINYASIIRILQYAIVLNAGSALCNDSTDPMAL